MPVVFSYGIAIIGLIGSLLLGSMGISNLATFHPHTTITRHSSDFLTYYSTTEIDGEKLPTKTTIEPNKIKINIKKDGKTTIIEYERDMNQEIDDFEKQILKENIEKIIKHNQKIPIRTRIVQKLIDVSVNYLKGLQSSLLNPK